MTQRPKRAARKPRAFDDSVTIAIYDPPLGEPRLWANSAGHIADPVKYLRELRDWCEQAAAWFEAQKARQ